MKRLFYALHERLAAGERAALCSVLASHGSVPRGQGARMAVFANGETVGTVGGGAVEYRAFLLAEQLIKGGSSKVQSFSLNKSEIADIGMVCGGDVLIAVQVFDNTETPDAILAALEKDTPSFLVTEIEGDSVKSFYVTETPPEPIKGRLYVDKLVSSGRVFVYGGGHVSRALVPVLAEVDFRITVVEDREEFADLKLFSRADAAVKADFSALTPDILPGRNDYAVIMTRGHQSDFDVLRQVLATPATYIGCIGSRHKIKHTKERLFALGFTEADFMRVHSPIGLPIKGETPQEIAISVAAEMILHRAENK
ncbi:MAG: XdhC family protein [Clostridia bacterium]|nr:XdhC family protein [Clostridia bacterium]